MDIDPQILEYTGRFLGAGLALGLGGLGAAIGMGYTAGRANEATMRQPENKGQLLRTMLIGQAIGGDASIFSLVVGIFILFVPLGFPEEAGLNFVAAMVGAGCAIGFGALGSGLGCGWPAGEAVSGAARNPRRVTPVTQAMIIGQAVAQSPSIFGLVIALVIILQRSPGSDWITVGACIAAGLAMGLSALGSGVGSGRTAGGAVKGVSRWPKVWGLTVRTMLIGQAVCETPAIFGMLLAFILLVAMPEVSLGIVGFAQILGAGIAVGVGGIGPGIGSGLAGGSGCEATADHDAREAVVLRTMLIGQAVAQSTAIYALIIALSLLYVV